MSTSTIILGILGLSIVGLYIWYISLIIKRNRVREALSDIDVQLKKRSDLIPNLLAIAKRFMIHEMGIMTQITELRSKVDQSCDKNQPEEIKKHFAYADQLADKLGQLKINVENYPDLKSNQTMIEAMDSLNEIEEQIAAARRFYNSAVTILNNGIQVFPGSVIAKIASVQGMPYYETDEASKSNVDATKLIY